MKIWYISVRTESILKYKRFYRLCTHEPYSVSIKVMIKNVNNLCRNHSWGH